MIEPYTVAVCQAEIIAPRSGGNDKIQENLGKNLERFCGFIDFACGGFMVGRPGFHITGPPKLVTFGEYALTGLHHPADPSQKTFTKKEIIKYLAIRMPGPETDVLASKAKQYGTYIAAANLEYDPEWPDLFFNTGFIINPAGKIILKYRKTVTNVPIAMHCSVHDIMDAYKNPITGKYDAFPVVNTSIGRLAIMICVDLRAPEIPRVYSMKGAEVVMHLTRGMSTSQGGGAPIGVNEACLQARAFDNAVYLVHSKWGPELGAYYPRARSGGYSRVYNYEGIKIAEADDGDEQIVRAKLDIEACRQYRERYARNPVTMVRTELYAPYYGKTIYPVNTFLRDGPIEEILGEQQQGYFKQAIENFKQCQDFYDESEA